MPRKYFFFDIDGTLTDDATHKIVPSAERTLHALETNGHFVSIATGRAHYKAQGFADSIGIRNMVCNGGECLVLDGKVIENRPLDHETAMFLVHHAEKAGLGYLLMTDDSDRVLMKDTRFLEQAGRRTELTTYVLDPDLVPEEIPQIFKVYIAMTKEQEPDNPWIQKRGHLRMGPGYLNFQHDAKKDGILRMLKAVDGNESDVVVFGDAVNDLVMFDPRWTSIAMGNGMQELKDKADYVTAANIDDGIEKACRRFGWI